MAMNYPGRMMAYPFGMPMGMGWGQGAMGGYGPGGYGFWGGGYGPWGYGPWGGTYPGPSFYAPSLPLGYVPSDDQIRGMFYEALDADPSVPFNVDVNADVTGGVVTLTGTVPSKMVKHSVGDDAWLLPGVIDVNNNLQIVGRRTRQEEQAPPGGEARPMRRGAARRR